MRRGIGLAMLALGAIYLGPPTARAGGLRVAVEPGLVSSGLMALLAPAFEAASGLRLQITPAPAGEALDMARRGALDAVITDAPEIEGPFIHQGFGIHRRVFLLGWFVLVGPPGDPAGVARIAALSDAPREMSSCAACGKGQQGFGIATVLRRVNVAPSSMLAAPPGTGTAWREAALREEAGLPPMTTGTANEAPLATAGARGSYLLCDEGAFRLRGETNGLRILYARREKELMHTWSVAAVDPTRVPGADLHGAVKFINWLLSPRTAAVVGELQDPSGRPIYTFSAPLAPIPE